MSEWIAVLGRFKPLGEANPSNNSSYEYRELERTSALLQKDGQPICRTVRLERIVQQPSISTERAAEEFLRLTEESTG